VNAAYGVELTYDGITEAANFVCEAFSPHLIWALASFSTTHVTFSFQFSYSVHFTTAPFAFLFTSKRFGSPSISISSGILISFLVLNC
jgi:hypothetical protein